MTGMMLSTSLQIRARTVRTLGISQLQHSIFGQWLPRHEHGLQQHKVCSPTCTPLPKQIVSLASIIVQRLIPRRACRCSVAELQATSQLDCFVLDWTLNTTV